MEATTPRPILSDDTEAACFRVTAPDGYCFEPGLHELVSVYEPGINKAEARRAARADMRHAIAICAEGTRGECDWCNDLQPEGGA